MPILRTFLMTAAACALAATAVAKPWWLRGAESNEDDFLAPDVAFRVAAHANGDRIQVRWVIAPGYYLYRHKMQIEAESPDLTLGEAAFPRGTRKTDPYLGNQEIYTQQIEATVPYTRIDYGAHPLQVKVTYQGCAEAGLCYPPITKVLFPGAAPVQVAARPLGWERYAIGGGLLSFLVAGGVLRKGRRLDQPA